MSRQDFIQLKYEVVVCNLEFGVFLQLSSGRDVKDDFLQHLPHAFLHLSSAYQLKKYGSNGKLLVDLYDCQHLSSCKVSLVEPAEVGAVAVQVVAGVGGHWGGS